MVDALPPLQRCRYLSIQFFLLPIFHFVLPVFHSFATIVPPPPLWSKDIPRVIDIQLSPNPLPCRSAVFVFASLVGLNFGPDCPGLIFSLSPAAASPPFLLSPVLLLRTLSLLLKGVYVCAAAPLVERSLRIFPSSTCPYSLDCPFV